MRPTLASLRLLEASLARTKEGIELGFNLKGSALPTLPVSDPDPALAS